MKPDREGKLILPPHFSRRILWVIPLLLVSVYSAFLNGLADNCFLASSLFVTSLVYWNHPVEGTRRKIDLFTANGSILYQAVYSAPRTSSLARNAYWLVVCMMLICYSGARHFGRYRVDDNSASLFHCSIHVFGNVGNLLLYDSLGVNALGFGL